MTCGRVDLGCRRLFPRLPGCESLRLVEQKMKRRALVEGRH